MIYAVLCISGFLDLFALLFYVSGHFAVDAHHVDAVPTEVTRGCWILRTGITGLWVLGIEPLFSARGASALSCLAILTFSCLHYLTFISLREVF